MRSCACGCGVSLEGRRPDARYASSNCRTRHWKATTGYGDQRTRKPSRNGSQTPRKPELRISYRKAVAEVAALLRDDGFDEVRANSIATDTLDPLLTDRQRAAL